MSQEAVNLPQGTKETHDCTFTITANTPLGSIKMGYSGSGKSDKNNTLSKPASPVVSDDVAEIKGTRNDVVAANEEREGGGGDGIAMDASESKFKSSSDEGDCELMNFAAGASEGGSGGNGNKEVKNSTNMGHMIHAWTERDRRKEMNNKFDLLHALVPNLPKKTDQTTIVEATINYIKNLQDEVQKLETLKMERQRGAAANGSSSEGSTPAPAAAAAAVAVDTLAPPPPEEEEELTREMSLADLVHVWEQEVAADSGRGTPAPAPPPPAPMQTWTGPNMTVSLTGHDAFITLSLPRSQNLVAAAVCVLERHHIDVVTATVSTPEQGSSLLSLHCHLSPACTSSQNLTPLDKYKLAVSELMLWVSV
ncbi:hypothetical protein E2562_029716 [Oryza meyeriana var. granulata]|uniref:BHLH domain-containing protein n=1 Tax=Oryza meyeriana var. granulata TaxID=110450 RepID=A0A6G1C1T7_9ORYZ|nr:hypothetical protein E2562_029716 [Oryza meyeriana var. granulata]